MIINRLKKTDFYQNEWITTFFLDEIQCLESQY